MDVDDIDALNPAELEAVLERALDPRVPVELLYAVLERLGRLDREAAAGQPVPGEAPAPGETPQAAVALPAPASAALTAWLPAVPAQATPPAAPAPEPVAGESEG